MGYGRVVKGRKGDGLGKTPVQGDDLPIGREASVADLPVVGQKPGETGRRAVGGDMGGAAVAAQIADES